jgi:hypothetical protein
MGKLETASRMAVLPAPEVAARTPAQTTVVTATATTRRNLMQQEPARSS